MTPFEAWLNRKPKPRGQRKRLPVMSAKRRRDLAVYSTLRERFLEAHPYCQVWLRRMCIPEEWAKQLGGRVTTMLGTVRDVPRSQEIHHAHGRSGTNYLDTSTWLAVSRKQHEWIHANPSEARSKGFLQ